MFRYQMRFAGIFRKHMIAIIRFNSRIPFKKPSNYHFFSQTSIAPSSSTKSQFNYFPNTNINITTTQISTFFQTLVAPLPTLLAPIKPVLPLVPLPPHALIPVATLFPLSIYGSQPLYSPSESLGFLLYLTPFP